MDVGRVINPDGVINQVEGGAIQSASWALRERVRFDRTRITSVTWDSYPILRFTEVPEVAVRIVAAPGEPEAGAGELAQGPVAGAIGNAVADAVGVRVRDLPLTTEQVIRAYRKRLTSGARSRTARGRGGPAAGVVSGTTAYRRRGEARRRRVLAEPAINPAAAAADVRYRGGQVGAPGGRPPG